MIVLPAIDIKNGKCVRLRQGIKDDETVYFQDPAQVAVDFEKNGVQYLHIVDLDGAFEGEPKNIDLIKKIADSISIPFEIGGGIRSLPTAQAYIDAGADRIIIGTKAIEDVDFLKDLVSRFEDKVAVSLDCKGNSIVTKGWTEDSHIDLFDFIQTLKDIGVKNVIYTDISRDGMLSEPNYDILSKLNAIDGIDIIASGGIASVDQLHKLKNMNIHGAITGKAIYEGKISLDEVNQLC